MNSVSNSFRNLPHEILLKLAEGPPCTTIKTLCSFSRICKALNEKVALCWKIFVRQSAHMGYLFPPCKQEQDSLKYLIDCYPTLKKWSFVDLEKWKNTNPTVSETSLAGSTEQCLTFDSQGYLSLLTLGANRNKLWCTYFETNQHFSIDCSKPLKCLSFKVNPSIVFSKNWMAMCYSFSTEEIEIFNLSGIHSHTINNIGTIVQLEFHENALYVLRKVKSNQYSLLIYSEKDWTLISTLDFPEDVVKVHRFFLIDKKIIFSTYNLTNKYKLLLISMNSCFLNPLFTQIEYPSLPHIKIIDGKIFIIYSNPPLSIESSVTLGSIDVENSSIKIVKLLKLPISRDAIADYHIQQNKIFILKQDIIFSFLCYDLKNGEFIKEFIPDEEKSCLLGTNFMPQIAVSTPERIHTLYNSIQDTSVTTTKIVTKLFSLDFV